MPTLFETLFLWRGTDIQSYRDILESEISSGSSYEDRMDRRLEIVNFHLRTNSRYQTYVNRSMIDHWAQIPVIGKQEFQQGYRKWVSGPWQNKKMFVNTTSGSSGVPLKFAKDWECHARTWALIAQRYQWHGVDVFRDLEARFYGIPLDHDLKYLKEKAKDFIARRVRFPVFDLSDDVLKSYYRRFEKKSFVYLNGYTSSLVTFARYIIRNELQNLKAICPSLTICITTSEMCSPDDLDVMEEGFGVEVVNEYGAAELDIIAFEDEDGDWVLNEENLYVEVVDDEGHTLPAGREGRILVTALYNKAMPFIRYELGDRGIISPNTKNGYRLLEKLTGRTNDMATLPSGRVVPGLTFYYVTKSLLFEEGLIREMVVRQRAVDHFELLYTASRDLSGGEIKEVEKLMELYMEPGLKLNIIRVDQIQRQPSGKLKQFEKIF